MIDDQLELYKGFGAKERSNLRASSFLDQPGYIKFELIFVISFGKKKKTHFQNLN